MIKLGNTNISNHKKLLSYKGRKYGRPLSKSKQDILNKVLLKNSVSIEEIFSKNFFKSSYFPLSLEIGCGSGEFIIGKAKENRDKGFFVVEQYINGLASLASKIRDSNLTNIKIFPDDVTKILNVLPHNYFDRIYLLFPDPWPKLKHHKRRIIQKEIVEIFSKLLVNNGYLWFVSDHMEYSRFALLHFQNNPSFKWAAEKPEDWLKKPLSWIDTRYEIKAKKRGISPVFLKFIKS